MNDFKIRFLQEFYGIHSGQVVTFHNGVLVYPDGFHSYKYESADNFIDQNRSLKIEKVQA